MITILSLWNNMHQSVSGTRAMQSGYLHLVIVRVWIFMSSSGLQQWRNVFQALDLSHTASRACRKPDFLSIYTTVYMPLNHVGSNRVENVWTSVFVNVNYLPPFVYFNSSSKCKYLFLWFEVNFNSSASLRVVSSRKTVYCKRLAINRPN